MNTIQAQERMWLFNGESFAKKVSGFGDLSKWEEVSNDFKTQWEEEHKVDEFNFTNNNNGGINYGNLY